MKSLLLKYCTISFAILFTAPVFCQPTEILLPAQAPAQRSVELEEVWRIGGDDDEDVLLGVVANGVLDHTGTIYLLDSQLSQILVINTEGQMTGTLSREGEGPGELQQPISIFLNSPSQLGVAQAFPGKLVLLNIDGTPGGTIKPESNPDDGGFVFVGEAFKKGNHLVLNHGYGSFDMNTGKIMSTQILSELNNEGFETGRFAEHVQERSMNKQVFDEQANASELDTWALGLNIVYTVPHRDKYFINVKNMDGSVAKTISRPFEPRKRSADDKKDLVSGFNVVVNGQKMEVEEHILDFDPALNKLYVGNNGRLFAENCWQKTTLLPEGIAARFDVISSDGILMEELTLELDGFNPHQDRLAFLDGVHFLWVRNFQSAYDAMNSSLATTETSLDDELDDIESLEIIFCRMAQ